MKHKFYLTTAAALCSAVIGCAYAESSSDKDGLSINDARVGMGQAVTTAEQYIGGKAIHAEFEHHKDRTTYDVEVLKDKKVMKVKVDPTSGKVLSSVEDKDDEHHKGY
jgi:uncharacterized membrane protein YkoI